MAVYMCVFVLLIYVGSGWPLESHCQVCLVCLALMTPSLLYTSSDRKERWRKSLLLRHRCHTPYDSESKVKVKVTEDRCVILSRLLAYGIYKVWIKLWKATLVCLDTWMPSANHQPPPEYSFLIHIGPVGKHTERLITAGSLHKQFICFHFLIFTSFLSWKVLWWLLKILHNFIYPEIENDFQCHVFRFN